MSAAEQATSPRVEVGVEAKVCEGLVNGLEEIRLGGAGEEGGVFGKGELIEVDGQSDDR